VRGREGAKGREEVKGGIKGGEKKGQREGRGSQGKGVQGRRRGGLVHRDIKLVNTLLEDGALSPRSTITDFGWPVRPTDAS